MADEPEPIPQRRWFGLHAGAANWLWLSLAVIVLDQWTKYIITSNLALYDDIVVVPGFLDIVRLHNPGAAWSFLADASGWQRWVFTGLGIVVSIGILVWLRTLPARGKHLLAAGLCFVLGGALGNVIDRVLHGYVVDFVRVHYYDDWFFPAFNVADSAITVGAALLILENIVDWWSTRARARNRQVL
jgi:signal peptidase II